MLHRGGIIAGSCAFSPDGRTLAVGCETGEIRCWHLATGQETLVLRGHRWPVHHLAFSRDGTVLASMAPTDASATEGFLWRAASRSEVEAAEAEGIVP